MVYLCTLVFLVVLPLVLCIEPDGYCNPAYPSWRAQPEYPLKHLTVIIRHGDRSPVFQCWPDATPWTCTLRHQERPLSHVGNRLYTKDYISGREFNPGNCGNGHLTQVGIEQQLKNGHALKKLYGHLLPAEFNPDLIYVRSTDVPRTFLSGEGLLFGLYPPEEGCTDKAIVMDTIDPDTDNMTPNYVRCPLLDKYEKHFQKSTAFKHFNATVIMPLEADLQKIFDIMPGYEIDRMFDCIEAFVCRGYAIPDGLTQELYARVIQANMDEYANGAFYKVPNTDYNFIQVAMANFIGDVINNIDAVSTNQTQQVLALFSGHDTTVLPFVMAYNAWTDGVWPAYASMIRIELLEGPNGDLIRMYYNNKLLLIPGCESQTCDYETFKRISKHLAAANAYCSDESA